MKIFFKKVKNMTTCKGCYFDGAMSLCQRAEQCGKSTFEYCSTGLHDLLVYEGEFELTSCCEECIYNGNCHKENCDEGVVLK